MLLRELFEEIPTMDPSKIFNGIFKKYEGYPKNSISPREIVSSHLYDKISIEDARKLCDELNEVVTKTILTFHTKKRR